MTDTPESADVDPVQRLAREYAEARRQTREPTRYVQQPRDSPLQYDTFNYLPEHHFQRAYDQLTQSTGHAIKDGTAADTCQQCGGPVHRVRTDQHAHLEVAYYRCQAEDGCRQGGERVYDRTGELVRTAGPVFEQDGLESVNRMLDQEAEEVQESGTEDDTGLEPDGGYRIWYGGM